MESWGVGLVDFWGSGEETGGRRKMNERGENWSREARQKRQKERRADDDDGW